MWNLTAQRGPCFIGNRGVRVFVAATSLYAYDWLGFCACVASFLILFVDVDTRFARMVQHLLLNTSSLIRGLDTTQMCFSWNSRNVQFRNAFRYFSLRGSRLFACGVCPSGKQQRVGCAWITAQRQMMIACGIPVDKDVDVLEGVQGQAFVGAVGILFGLAPSKKAPLYRLNVPTGVLRLSKVVSATLPDVSTLPTHAHGRVDSSDSEEEEKVTHTVLCVALVPH